jgi:hypothetical protein
MLCVVKIKIRTCTSDWETLRWPLTAQVFESESPHMRLVEAPGHIACKKEFLTNSPTDSRLHGVTLYNQ